VVKKKLPKQLTGLISTLKAPNKYRRATTAEGRCLLTAFCEIRDPSLRAIIVELVEKLADKRKN
jgi:hypothetical protein